MIKTLKPKKINQNQSKPIQLSNSKSKYQTFRRIENPIKRGNLQKLRESKGVTLKL